MYGKKFFPILGLSFLAFSASVSADNYVGGNFAIVEYSEQAIDSDLSLSVLFARAGTFFNENFAGEVRVGFGVGDDSIDIEGIDVDFEVDNVLGVYLRGGAQVGDGFFPYAVVGFTRGEFTVSIPAGTYSDDESDLSYGVGLDVNLTETLTVNGEYMSYIDKDGGELSGFSAGVAWRF